MWTEPKGSAVFSMPYRYYTCAWYWCHLGFFQRQYCTCTVVSAFKCRPAGSTTAIPSRTQESSCRLYCCRTRPSHFWPSARTTTLLPGFCFRSHHYLCCWPGRLLPGSGATCRGTTHHCACKPYQYSWPPFYHHGWNCSITMPSHPTPNAAAGPYPLYPTPHLHANTTLTSKPNPILFSHIPPLHLTLHWRLLLCSLLATVPMRTSVLFTTAVTGPLSPFSTQAPFC